MKVVKYYIVYTLFCLSSLIPAANAQGNSPGGTGNPGGLSNPLQFDTLEEVLKAIAGWLYTISLPIITIMILFGAFQILTAAGRPDQIAKGKKTITWAVIGAVVILIAGGISQIIASILSGGGSGGDGGGRVKFL